VQRTLRLERVKVEQFLDQLLVIAFDRVVAQHSASLRVELQRGGSTIGAYDLLIAAEAMRSGLILVSSNERELRRSRIFNWSLGAIDPLTLRRMSDKKLTPRRDGEEKISL
jgi:predicted nucleic acid-binding protein